MRHRGSNPGPLDYEPDALPLSYGGGKHFGPKIDVFEPRMHENLAKFKSFAK